MSEDHHIDHHSKVSIKLTKEGAKRFNNPSHLKSGLYNSFMVGETRLLPHPRGYYLTGDTYVEIYWNMIAMFPIPRIGQDTQYGDLHKVGRETDTGPQVEDPETPSPSSSQEKPSEFKVGQIWRRPTGDRMALVPRENNPHSLVMAYLDREGWDYFTAPECLDGWEYLGEVPS